MVTADDPEQTPNAQTQNYKVPGTTQNGHSFISPRFKSVAAMSGWDEESIIMASLVEESPDRDFKQNRRTHRLHFNTPPPNSRRKRRPLSRSSFVPVIDLEEEQDDSKKEEKVSEGPEKDKTEEETSKGGGEEKSESSTISSSNPAVPCLDKLRDELSCAICLEICFEPSTTSCGHSFCKKCLCSAADKCGKKCPKCRQLISNGRSCIVNTVLWNTIQLLFPKEVEARKTAQEEENQSSESSRTNAQRENFVWLSTNGSRRTDAPRQAEDAAVAQRLQREDLSRLLTIETEEGRRRQMRNHGENVALARRPGGDLLEFLRGEAEEGRRRQMRNHDENVALARRLGGDLLEFLRGEAEEGRRRQMRKHDENVALARRLGGELLESLRGGSEERANNSTSLARANRRAMASRATNIRMRNRPQ